MARRSPSNYALLAPYAAPYFAYVAGLSGVAALFPGPSASGQGFAYIVAGLGAAAGLFWGWRWTLPLRGPGSPLASVALGVAGGLAGTVLWVAAKAPFYEPGGQAWTSGAFWLRFAASASLVAIFEEMLFRGLVLRGAFQWSQLRRAGDPQPLTTTLHDRSVNEVPPEAWNGFAVLASSLLFAAGHAPREIPAALLFGIWMAALTRCRRDLLTPVVAHGTTNAVLALYVRATGQWNLW